MQELMVIFIVLAGIIGVALLFRAFAMPFRVSAMTPRATPAPDDAPTGSNPLIETYLSYRQ